MSWPISHTDDALVFAAQEIAKLNRKTLEIAAVSWKNELRSHKVRVPRFNVRQVVREVLLDFVTTHALGEFGRCSHGGWMLYVDAEGWIQVPFGPPREEE